ncbi:MAG: SdpI family protein [Gemmatimonadota bacterium]
MRTRLWPGLTLVLAATIFGIASRGALPDRVASHWNLAGEANGWSSPTALVVGFPLLALFAALVLTVAPRVDPKRGNFPEHASEYWLVGNTLLAFLAALFAGVVGVNTGWPVQIDTVLGVGLGVLFLVIGNVLTRVRPNWIFGVRTPWTLSSERSWRESHRVAGYGFVLVGLMALLLTLLGTRRLMLPVMIGIGVVALSATVWSFIAWKHDPNAIGRNP